MADPSALNGKILLLGSRGMIGTALAKHFSGPNLSAYSRQELDITDYVSLERAFLRLKPEIVLNAAAFTRVDDCEKFREAAFLVNAQAPGHLAALCKKHNSLLIHFSTDYVFDGSSNHPHREDDSGNPANYYGVTKWEADKKILSSGCSYLIIRTSWIFGKSGDNFVKKILKRALAGANIQAPSDQVGAPTYADDVGSAVRRLMTLRLQGLFNFTGSGSCSRFEQAQIILKLYGLNNSVEAVKNDGLHSPAKRPPCSLLELTKYIESTGHTPRFWQQATADYIEFLKQNEYELRS